MQIDELSRPLKKALATNANTSSFASKVFTITEPANDGVIGVASGGAVVPREIILFPYGLGSDNDVYSLRVIAWRRLRSGNDSYWLPSSIGEFSCTISAAVGVAGGPVLNTERF